MRIKTMFRVKAVTGRMVAAAMAVFVAAVAGALAWTVTSGDRSLQPPNAEREYLERFYRYMPYAKYQPYDTTPESPSQQIAAGYEACMDLESMQKFVARLDQGDTWYLAASAYPRVAAGIDSLLCADWWMFSNQPFRPEQAG